MKRRFTILTAAIALLVSLAIPMGMRGQTNTLVSGSGTSGYTIPDGWSSSGTVEGGSYLKFDDGTITSPEFAPHNELSFTYSVATFGSGTNHPLTIRILNASTNAVIVEKTTATPTSSSYINTDSPLSIGDVDVAFKIQMYAPTGKGVRLRNYSVTGIPAGDQQLTPSDLALVDAPVELEFDLYDNANAQTISYTTSSTGAVTVSQNDYITTTVNANNNTITVTPVAVTNGTQTITVNQAADETYAAGSASFTVSITNSEPSIVIPENELSLSSDANESGSFSVSFTNGFVPNAISPTLYSDADCQEQFPTSGDGAWIVLTTTDQSTINYSVAANNSTTERTVYMKVIAADYYSYGNPVSITNVFAVTQAAPVIDYATLPFEWEGGASAAFLALNGVTAYGLGSDYASNNAPYLIKFDGNGDYIQVKCDQQPGKVTIGVKMIGGASTSKITIQGSVDGETFTDVEELTISGAQNDVLTLETTNAFAADVRYVRMLFTKGSNVGVGPISIALPSTDPSISANDVEVAYDATSGSINYTINNFAEGGIVSATSFVSWVTFGEGETGATVTASETGTIPFTITENTDASARQTDILLQYIYGESQGITTNVTITQAGNPNVTMTIAEVRAQGTGDVVTTGIVTSCVGTTGYIQDATAAICVYGTSLTVGDEIRVSGTLSTYHGLLEITNPEVTVISQGNTVNPEVMTIADINASTNQGWYVRIEDATVTEINGQNTTIAQGESTIVVRGISGVEYAVNDVITLNGNIGCYDGNQIANPQNVEVQYAPSITFDPDVVDLDSEMQTIQISFTYENIVVTDYQSFTVHQYDANGEEIQPDPETPWYVLGVTGSNDEGYQLTGLVTANEGEARSAYMKVSALDAAGNTVYSNLVTINQAAPVAPATGDEYSLYTGELVEGDYLIVYDGGAMNTTVTSDRLQYEDVTVNNDVIVTDNAAIVWHIAPTGQYWTIYNANADAYAASTGVKNKAQMLADGTDDKALWTVSGTETYEFVNKKNSESNVNANLRKNGTYGFACYATSTGGALSLYKKVDEPALQTFTKTIVGYGTGTGNYYLIASPVGDVNPTEVDGLVTDAFDLYYFDEEGDTEGNEWINYDPNTFNLVSGKGYLYASQDTTILTFTGTPVAGTTYEVTLAMTENADWSGWNLVGNPFAQTAYINGDFEFYTMNNAGDKLWASTSNSIEAMEGVFVIANQDEETLTFTTEDPANPGKNVVLNVSDNHGLVDRAIVRFGESRQLPKFQLNPNSTKLYIPMDDNDYAVVRSEEVGEMPVNFKAENDGSYTISIESENVEFAYLHLIDNMTNTDVDLLETPNYSFNARMNDNANRFKLVFATGTLSVSDNFAFFSNGSLVINNEGEATMQVIDINGRVLSSETINGNANVNVDAVAGVYMIRLVNGNNVKVQKIVVR